jgi:hypothetical protein
MVVVLVLDVNLTVTNSTTITTTTTIIAAAVALHHALISLATHVVVSGGFVADRRHCSTTAILVKTTCSCGIRGALVFFLSLWPSHGH